MTSGSASRRDFLKTAAAAGTLAAISNAHAAGSDVLRVGLIGCGDRGTGAATQALAADSNVKLVAMADAFEDRLQKSLEILQKDEKVAGQARRQARPSLRRLRRLPGAARQRRRRGAALHAAALPPAAPPRGGRGRQARLRREAGRRRCPGRPLGARRAASWPRKKGSRSSPACASATTTASARPSGASTTGRSARSSRSSPTTTGAAAGPSRASPTGPTCCTRCGTGTTSPGCRATSTSSSTSTSSMSAPG